MPQRALKPKAVTIAKSSAALMKGLRMLIQTARARAATAVNAGLVILYWGVGDRIRRETLRFERAEYGRQIVAALSRELTREFGRGFAESALWRMIQFVDAFPDPNIVATLSRELGWSHFVELIPITDVLRREFYAQMCRVERWSVRTLRHKINNMLFERTAISKRPEVVVRRELKALRETDQVSPDLVFRDPYILDFLGLADAYGEKDLEAAILREIERFILELGSDFAFVARQKRVTVDNEDYYLDLLFYHRGLGRLVAVDLKLGKFQAADKGQMELYLRWLEHHDRRPTEATPIGLILCAGKSDQHVELLGLTEGGIRVAEYLIELPPREVLERKLLNAVQVARRRLEDQSGSKQSGGARGR